MAAVPQSCRCSGRQQKGNGQRLRPAAQAWKSSNTDWKEGRSVLVLFTASGQYCSDRSARVVRQGDDIYVGVLSREDDTIQKVDVQFTPCERPKALSPTSTSRPRCPRSSPRKPSGWLATLNIYDVRRCYNATTRVAATITPGPGVTPIGAGRSLNLNARYRGTLQIGSLVYRSPQELLRPSRQRWPEAHLQQRGREKWPRVRCQCARVRLSPRYPHRRRLERRLQRGRDILNDYDWRDRLGLVFSAGLDDPGDRFGVGLAFEVAYGINVFYTKHWYRQQRVGRASNR